MTERRRARERAIRFAVPGIVFMFTSVVIVVFWASRLNDVLPWWTLAIVLAIGLVLLLGATAVGLLVGQRIVGDKVEVALQTTGGRWRHGRADIRGHTIEFYPYYWQVRVATGEQVDVSVLSFDILNKQRPRLRELWALSFQVRIVTAATTTGTIRLAALPSALDRIAGELEAKAN